MNFSNDVSDNINSLESYLSDLFNTAGFEITGTSNMPSQGPNPISQNNANIINEVANIIAPIHINTGISSQLNGVTGMRGQNMENITILRRPTAAGSLFSSVSVDADWGDFVENLLQTSHTIPSSSRRNSSQNSWGENSWGENSAGRPYVEELLQRTLLDTRKKYREVLSEKGKEQLITKTYTKENFPDQSFCAISQKEFTEGEMVSQLPCNHIFEPAMISKWLEKENASCPICRFKLKSIEKKDESQANTTLPPAVLPITVLPTVVVPPATADAIFAAPPATADILPPIAATPAEDSAETIPAVPTTVRSRTPTIQHYVSSLYQNMLERQDAAQEEEDLQAALMASLESYTQAEETSNDAPDEN
jgi:hypothetical protein